MRQRVGIVITPKERSRLKVTDFGRGEFAQTGLQLLTHLNARRCCAEEAVLAPRQTCPEHRHPPVGGPASKEKTFCCRWRTGYLYVLSDPPEFPACLPTTGSETPVTGWHEIRLHPGEQYTVAPNMQHWFQTVAEGAIVSEFSVRDTAEDHLPTDPRIVNDPRAGGDSPDNDG
jgi:D-lyxose ketol-isomerase